MAFEHGLERRIAARLEQDRATDSTAPANGPETAPHGPMIGFLPIAGSTPNADGSYTHPGYGVPGVHMVSHPVSEPCPESYAGTDGVLEGQDTPRPYSALDMDMACTRAYNRGLEDGQKAVTASEGAFNYACDHARREGYAVGYRDGQLLVHPETATPEKAHQQEVDEAQVRGYLAGLRAALASIKTLADEFD